MSWPPFHPAARREFDEAFDFLAADSPDAARRFLRSTQAAIRVVREYPEAGRPLGGTARRFPIRPFPYQLVYLADAGDIQVIAIAHERRRPEYWQARA